MVFRAALADPYDALAAWAESAACRVRPSHLLCTPPRARAILILQPVRQPPLDVHGWVLPSLCPSVVLNASMYISAPNIISWIRSGRGEVRAVPETGGERRCAMYAEGPLSSWGSPLWSNLVMAVVSCGSADPRAFLHRRPLEAALP